MPESTSQIRETQVTDAYDLPESSLQLQPVYPLFLYPNDHHGMTLVSKVLNDSNFS